MTEREAWEALAGVVDPELGIDIVELGLVYAVELDGDAVGVTMTLTTAGCPLHDVIVDGVERALAQAGAPGSTSRSCSTRRGTPSRIGTGGLRELGAPGAGG